MTAEQTVAQLGGGVGTFGSAPISDSPAHRLSQVVSICRQLKMPEEQLRRVVQTLKHQSHEQQLDYLGRLRVAQQQQQQRECAQHTLQKNAHHHTLPCLWPLMRAVRDTASYCGDGSAYRLQQEKAQEAARHAAAAENAARVQETRQMEEDGIVTATEPGAVATDPELSTMLETEALEQADLLSASGQAKELVFTQYCPQKVLPSPAAQRAPLVCRKRYEARFASWGWRIHSGVARSGSVATGTLRPAAPRCDS